MDKFIIPAQICYPLFVDSEFAECPMMDSSTRGNFSSSLPYLPQFPIGDSHKHRLPSLRVLGGAVRRGTSVTGAAASAAPDHRDPSAQPTHLPQFSNQGHQRSVRLHQGSLCGLTDGRVQRIEPKHGLCRIGGAQDA